MAASPTSPLCAGGVGPKRSGGEFVWPLLSFKSEPDTCGGLLYSEKEASVFILWRQSVFRGAPFGEVWTWKVSLKWLKASQFTLFMTSNIIYCSSSGKLHSLLAFFKGFFSLLVQFVRVFWSVLPNNKYELVEMVMGQPVCKDSCPLICWRDFFHVK